MPDEKSVLRIFEPDAYLVFQRGFLAEENLRRHFLAEQLEPQLRFHEVVFDQAEIAIGLDFLSRERFVFFSQLSRSEIRLSIAARSA